jgi:hypothetical protein
MGKWIQWMKEGKSIEVMAKTATQSPQESKFDNPARTTTLRTLKDGDANLQDRPGLGLTNGCPDASAEPDPNVLDL